MKTKIRITITQRTVWTRERTLPAEGPVVDITPQRPESEPAVKRPGLWTRLARMLPPALAVMASAQVIQVPDRPARPSTKKLEQNEPTRLVS